MGFKGKSDGVMSAWGFAGMAVNGLLDLVFPDSIYCIGCGAIIDKSRVYSLCDSCMEKFHFANGKTCVKCGRLLSDDYPHLLCTSCTEQGCENFLFDRGYTCMLYGLY